MDVCGTTDVVLLIYISEAKGMSAVFLDVVVRRPFVELMVTGDDIINGEMENERSVRETRSIRCYILELLTNNTGSVEGENEVSREEEADCEERF